MILKVLVVSDAHIIKDKKGNYWCDTAVHGYEFWQRYLEVFDRVEVVARVKYDDNICMDKYVRADGIGVNIKELPFVRGFKGYVIHFFRIVKEIKQTISDEEVAIFRVPSLPAFILLHFWKKLKRPYAFEVIVDPKDCYKDNLIARSIFPTILKKEIKKANGVSYVTKEALQNRYPSASIINKRESKNYFDSYYSSINLKEDFFGSSRVYSDKKKLKIIHVASAINSDVKGHTTLINIVEVLKSKGHNVSLKCIGKGNKVDYYKEMVAEKGLEKEISFVGVFSSKEEIKNLLEESDLFLFPSRAEGLPRAVIEAMAVGLPCLSTPVNGIPELLEKEYLFDPDDIKGFSDKIESLLVNTEELSKMSEKNFVKAHEYLASILQNRRNEFYFKLSNVNKNQESKI